MQHGIKIAFRYLKKGKLYTFIHIFGITVGLTACLLIGTVVIDEWSYDKQWSRSADTYRLLSIREGGGAYHRKGGTVYGGLGPSLKKNFPEVEDYSEIYPMPIHLKINKTDDLPLKATVLHADTAVYKLLDIRLIDHADLSPAGDINKIIISESFSNTHFGTADPLGRRIYDVPKYEERANEYIIAGVMRDLPANTHLRADMLMPIPRKTAELTPDGNGPGSMYVRQYILLRKGVDPAQFEQKVNGWYRRFTEVDSKLTFGLQPMEDIYLRTDFPAYQPVIGNAQHSYIFAAVAILLLCIACINYVNLSTARANSRLKETGVQKILGASRKDIMLQSLSESAIIFCVAAMLALLSYQLALPALENFVGHPLTFSFLGHWTYFAGAIATLALVCLFSGWYPAWLVSGQHMASSMQRILSGGKRNGWLRKSLIVLQFTISVTIMVSMLVVLKQVNFLKTKMSGLIPMVFSASTMFPGTINRTPCATSY
ncbi:MacB-like core domain-containing protein [Parapedobacter luteus]|uniref:MacB-like core domain-containing protein n=1 Tax=Parapedobacter luteus TaxID=623280 RepID=A0A1T5EC07_9SPHI|nr:ABC transporter permease [Parapedobacter luteus]SKB81478.1 MacB-like core domain-containing protein [Parapedobacter luteus]